MSNVKPSCPICDQNTLYDFSSRDLMFKNFERYDYHRCTQCSLIFQYPSPAPETISSFYPDEYDVYEESTRLKKISPLRAATLKQDYCYTHLNTKRWQRILANIIKLFNTVEIEIPYVKDGKLLDIGCGNGRFLHGMQQLGWTTKGVEFNESAVNTCRKSNLDVHHGDLFSAKLAGTSFDVVNLSHVIEHVPDPKALFVEISRILKPGGLLVVKTPNSEALGRALFSTNWFANEVPRHLFLFSKQNLKTLGAQCGLNMTEMRTSTSPKIILNSVDYVINNQGKPSKRIGWRRMLAKPYVWLAQYLKRGDEIQVAYTKSHD